MSEVKIVRLTTGEELIAKVCYMNEEDTLLVENPMVVEKINQKRGNQAIEGFHLREWMTATYDNMFVIKMNQVVTITELDKKIEVFYMKHLQNDKTIPGPNNQKDFAMFCYGNMPSCKDGDSLQCSKNNALFRTT